MTQQKKEMSGITPSIWGAPAWLFISCSARTYPLEPNPAEQLAAIHFVDSLQVMLPCSCRINFRKLLRKMEWKKRKWEYVANRESYSHFIHDVHNSVNRDLGKPEVAYTEFIKLDQFVVESCQGDHCAPPGSKKPTTHMKVGTMVTVPEPSKTRTRAVKHVSAKKKSSVTSPKVRESLSATLQRQSFGRTQK